MLETGLQLKSIYQKALVLDRKMRYKLSLVLKDMNSQKVGVHQTAIVPPAYDQDELAGSSLVLSSSLRVLDSIPASDEMFVIGDVKVRPNLDKSFTGDKPLGVYYQLYNVGLDQSTFQPSLRVTFRIVRDGTVVREVIDEAGESIQFMSAQRVVLLKELSLAELEQGRYIIQLAVEDRLTGQKLQISDEFQVVETGKRLALFSSPYPLSSKDQCRRQISAGQIIEQLLVDDDFFVAAQF